MMKKWFVVSSSLITTFLLLLTPVNNISAAPANNSVFATVQWVQVQIQQLLNTFNLHEQQNQTDFALVNSRVDTLEDRVNYLESLISITPTPAPLDGEIIFAFNRPASFTTDAFSIPLGKNYQSMTFRVSTTGSLSGWSALVNLGNDDMEQVRLNCGVQTCPEVTIPIIYSGGEPVDYKFSTGSSSGNITATATLNSEPNSHSILLGTNETLPFTSGDLVTGGYSKIVFTVGQTNPQHLTSISLQRFDGTNWNEETKINCDNGAVCPVQLISIATHAQYRVVVDGSGGGALINYLVRP